MCHDRSQVKVSKETPKETPNETLNERSIEGQETRKRRDKKYCVTSFVFSIFFLLLSLSSSFLLLFSLLIPDQSNMDEREIPGDNKNSCLVWCFPFFPPGFSRFVDDELLVGDWDGSFSCSSFDGRKRSFDSQYSISGETGSDVLWVDSFGQKELPIVFPVNRSVVTLFLVLCMNL